jgi:hypothetical protein
MAQLAREFWQDTQGFVVTAEMIILVTVLVLGLFTGLNILQSAVVSELTDVSASLQSLDQSYSLPSFRSLCVGANSEGAITASSEFVDDSSADASDNSDGACAVVPRDL